MSSSEVLVWIDLEMSGLDPDKERIIEIASVITGKDLDVIAEGPDLVVHQPEDILQAMDSWNTKHHAESGLIDAVRSSTMTEAEAESQTLAFLAEHTTKGKAPLAGNSIHTDRTFLRLYMPRIETWLHYRNVDVSTLKELGKRWYPSEHARRPQKRGSHRAKDDILESIAELRYYRGAFFR